MDELIRKPFNEVYDLLFVILKKYGFNDDDAEISARLFAETSRDGVYSHGLNRFPRYIEYISKGYIQLNAKPERIASVGAVEIWDGNKGPGNVNAFHCMQRAIEIAGENGIGLVSLRNTNHWMRGGSYGWQAADSNCIGICFTNTKPNMPPWGGINPAIGNNPLVIAVPHQEEHIVLDMAMSQFAYGKLEVLSSDNRKLPFPGGYNKQGKLTDDPAEILETERILPAGYWKGSGLSIMLDLLAALLSNGLSTHQIGRLDAESRLSQVFIAINIPKIDISGQVLSLVDAFKQNLKETIPVDKDQPVQYPGEKVMSIRKENLILGIPVYKSLWTNLLNL